VPDAKPARIEEPAAPPKDPPRWRIDPAPDGRGTPPDEKPPMVPRRPSFIAFLVGLLS
jgi:hypothetical protein